ncbi:MAG: phosphoribosyltransferase [Spirochaetales bacterium]|nr:phosphoribosyltransferase [Spirochaetales bacterium]
MVSKEFAGAGGAGAQGEAAGPPRYYLSYGQIHETVKRLAGEIQVSGFDPEVIVAIGTGGFVPARILKTFLNRPIYAVGISYYGVDNVPTATPRTIQWIDEVEDKLAGKRVLLVDEVDDSRVTLEYCLRELLSHRPAEIAVMVLHNKEKEKRGRLPSAIRHYFVGEQTADSWICYPWDAADIADHERRARAEARRANRAPAVQGRRARS